jgi:hypothetical protein
VPMAPVTVLQETVKPVLGMTKEVNETSPVNPRRLVTVIVEVVGDPAANDTMLDDCVSLKSGP